jgi:hypothetical protein
LRLTIPSVVSRPLAAAVGGRGGLGREPFCGYFFTTKMDEAYDWGALLASSPALPFFIHATALRMG